MNSWIVIHHQQENIIDLDNVFQGFSKISLENTTAYYLRDGKFIYDQIFDCSNSKMEILDGVILNLAELKSKYCVKDIKNIIATMETTNETFFSEFRGPFCGLQFNRNTNKLVAYSNQTGDAPLFYYFKDGGLIVSNDFNLIVNTLKAYDAKYNLDETAALYIMSFGYMIDDSTFVKEIKRLEPGKFLLLDKEGFSIKSYFSLSFKAIDTTLDDAIEKVDSAFRLAVKRCFDKDIEYGCHNHLVDASGGLDSRMVNWVACDMGYKKLFNISYSQSNTNEQKFASAVATELGNTFIHEQLDDASFVYDLDEIVGMEYGLAPYFAITGGKRLLSSLNMDCFGLEHTGQGGDAILGTFTLKDFPVKTRYKRYSDLLDVEVPDAVALRYQNLEEFLVNTRTVLGMFATHLIRRHYVYAVSPFLDVEFLSLCMSIPLELKRKHKLYWAWIDKKYPEVGKIKSTTERPKGKIEDFSLRAVRKLSRETTKVLFTIGLSKSKEQMKGMNPFQYWFDTNPKISEFINSYYNANKHLLCTCSETMQGEVEKMMESSNVQDKLLVLTVLATIRRYFGDKMNEYI